MKEHSTAKSVWAAATGVSLLLLALGIVVYVFGSQRQESDLKLAALTQLDNQAKLLSKWVDLRKAEIEVIAHTDVMREESYAAQLDYVGREARRMQPTYHSMGFSDSTGYLTLQDGKVIDIRNQFGFREAMGGQTVATSPVEDLARTGHMLILVRTPYFDRDLKVRGIISSGFRVLDLFNNYLDLQSDYSGSVSYILSPDLPEGAVTVDRGVTVVKPDLSPLSLGISPNAPPAVREMELNGEQRHLFTAPVAGTNWTVATAIPSAVLLRPIDVLRNQLLILLAIGQSVLFVLALVFYRHAERRAKTYSTRIRQLNETAYLDRLTSLPNRALLEDQLADYFREERSASPHSIGLAFIDLDRFKNLNATLGHSIGDRCLVQLSKRLSGHLPAGASAYRTGGDEFALLLDPLPDERQAMATIRMALDELARPLRLDDLDFIVTASAGLCVYPAHAEDAKDLLSRADLAMFRAKTLGGNRCELYDPAMSDAVLRRVRIEQRLRQAISRNEFSLVYQPIVSLANGQISAESLLRWNSSELGPVPPSEFIPVAEETGLIVEIGDWALKQVLLRTRGWVERGLNFGRVTVNLSAVQLVQDSFVPRVRSLFQAYGCPPERVVFEVTESAIITDFDRAQAALTALSDMGIGIALDDFGTGYSSLSVIQKLPVEVLKIDRSFVARLVKDSTDSKDEAILSAILSISRQTGMRTVAEGVETPDQLERIREIGCSHVQGYWISRPLTPEDFMQYVETRQVSNREGGNTA